jgi:hypothetical protein
MDASVDDIVHSLPFLGPRNTQATSTQQPEQVGNWEPLFVTNIMPPLEDADGKVAMDEEVINRIRKMGKIVWRKGSHL